MCSLRIYLVHFIPKSGDCLVAEVSEEKAMAEAEERSGLHGLEDFGVPAD